MFERENDGIDHINIYSNGKTKLGRLLSNFANTPFDYEPYGHFESMEAFWYYYFTECRYEFLKTLSGVKAKREGQKLMIGCYHEILESDKSVILEAIRHKLRQNRHIVDMLIENDLPLTHYYCYSTDNGQYKIINKPEFDWIIDEYNRLKTIIINKIIKKHINKIVKNA